MIDKELILKYIDGSCSEDQKRKIELAIEQDPFLADAVEGLKLSGANIAQKNIAEIDDKVNEKTGLPKAGRVFTLNPKKLLVAASVVGLLVSSVLIAQTVFKYYQENKLAKNETDTKIVEEKTIEAEPMQQAPVETTTNQEAVSPALVEQKETEKEIAFETNGQSVSTSPLSMVFKDALKGASDSKTDANVPVLLRGYLLDQKTQKPIDGALVALQGGNKTYTSQSGYYEIKANPGTYQLDIIKAGYADVSQKVKLSDGQNRQLSMLLTSNNDNNQLAYTPKVVEDISVKMMDEEAEQRAGNVQSVSKNKAVATAEDKKETSAPAAAADRAVIANSFDDGMDKFRIQDYNSSANLFEKSIKESNRTDAYYYAAMSYKNLGKTSKAISYFDKVSKTGGSLGAESKYQMAQIYIQKGQKNKAKDLLNELVNDNSYLKKQAEKQLEELH